MLQDLENIFDNAIRIFRGNLAGIPIHIDALETEQRFGQNFQADKVIRLNIGDQQIQYFVEIKTDITKAHIAFLLQLRGLLPGPVLLVAHHVNDAMAGHLKEIKIDFLDVAGNAFINQPPVFIYLKGNKPGDEFRRTLRRQVFRPTGLKVIFAFLCNPDLVNKNYRTIAHTAGVALGNIGMIVNDLRAQGFIFDKGKNGCLLVQRRRLLERFVEEYPRKLRRQLFLGTFKGDPDWWKKDGALTENAFWGGEVGAAYLSNFLKPQNVTVYVTRQFLNEFLFRNRLKRDEQGDVEILEQFWQPAGPGEWNGLVPPILVYADLVGTGVQRNIETAKVIYERDIVRLIRED